MLLDDPLSAVSLWSSRRALARADLTCVQVDAHVGKWLFDNAICGSLAGKTRVLVTHALHFLPRVDYIICLENGHISQEGTYSDLVADSEGAFSKLMAEFGGDVNEKKEEEAEKEEEAVEEAGKKKTDKAADKPKGLMQEEERAVGSVSGEGRLSVSSRMPMVGVTNSPSIPVYRKIFTLAHGYWTFPFLIASLAAQQGAQVVGSYVLVWWEDDAFNKASGFCTFLCCILPFIR